MGLLADVCLGRTSEGVVTPSPVGGGVGDVRPSGAMVMTVDGGVGSGAGGCTLLLEMSLMVAEMLVAGIAAVVLAAAVVVLLAGAVVVVAAADSDVAEVQEHCDGGVQFATDTCMVNQSRSYLFVPPTWNFLRITGERSSGNPFSS